MQKREPVICSSGLLLQAQNLHSDALAHSDYKVKLLVQKQTFRIISLSWTITSVYTVKAPRPEDGQILPIRIIQLAHILLHDLLSEVILVKTAVCDTRCECTYVYQLVSTSGLSQERCT